MEYMHSTTVPPPEVAIEYEETQNGYILRCFALLIEDTPLLVDGLAVEWLDQYGTLLSSDGKRQVGYIAHTSDGGVYTCQVSLSSENMSIALQQPTVTRVSHRVVVTSMCGVCVCKIIVPYDFHGLHFCQLWRQCIMISP